MSKAEVLHVLRTVNTPATMARFVSRMDCATVTELFAYLEYVDQATMRSWYGVYAELIKGGRIQ